MAKPKTLAELYAQRKAVEETNDLLDAKRKSPLSSVASGAVGGATVPAIITGLPILGSMIPEHAHRREQSLVGRAAKQLNPDVPEEALARFVDQVIKDQDPTRYNQLLEFAKQNKIEPRKIPIGELLEAAGKKMRPALPALGIFAALGGMYGYSSHKKKQRKADELLEAAKHASESTMDQVSREASDAFWAEVSAIDEVQSNLHKVASMNIPELGSVEMQIIQRAFADELEQMGMDKTAAFGFLKRLFSRGGDATTDMARSAIARHEAAMPKAREVIGASGGAPGSLNTAKANQMRAERFGTQSNAVSQINLRTQNEKQNLGGNTMRNLKKSALGT